MEYTTDTHDSYTKSKMPHSIIYDDQLLSYHLLSFNQDIFLKLLKSLNSLLKH
jgi:hypothetical protein